MAKTRSKITEPSSPAVIYAISDSTTNLVRHMLAAFLTQFPAGTFEVRYEGFVRCDADLERIFAGDAAKPRAVLHAVVSPGLKRSIDRHCRKLKIACCDVTGPTASFLAKVAGAAAAAADVGPDGLHRVDQAYLRRIEAVEFTMEHDDGLGLATLRTADVVLAGVSRTSKTPTCIYLAQQGLKAANVPLAMAVDPPEELLSLPPRKVIGLLIDPDRLTEIRSSRQAAWQMPTTGYNQRQCVEEEVAWSRRLFARMQWRTIDVTEQAVEETAGRIMQMVLPAPLKA
jgi:[pyruvate, water dikinase]-phosphate phosphotransferase / [pyruvate, water dikinase] kinase